MTISPHALVAIYGAVTLLSLMASVAVGVFWQRDGNQPRRRAGCLPDAFQAWLRRGRTPTRRNASAKACTRGAGPSSARRV